MKLSWNPQAEGPCGWMFQSGEALEVCFSATAASSFHLYVHTLMFLILFNGKKLPEPSHVQIANLIQNPHSIAHVRDVRVVSERGEMLWVTRPFFPFFLSFFF